MKVVETRKYQAGEQVELELSNVSICWALATSLCKKAEICIQSSDGNIFTQVQLLNVSFSQTVSCIPDDNFTIIFTNWYFVDFCLPTYNWP